MSNKYSSIEIGYFGYPKILILDPNLIRKNPDIWSEKIQNLRNRIGYPKFHIRSTGSQIGSLGSYNFAHPKYWDPLLHITTHLNSTISMDKALVIYKKLYFTLSWARAHNHWTWTTLSVNKQAWKSPILLKTSSNNSI